MTTNPTDLAAEGRALLAKATPAPLEAGGSLFQRVDRVPLTYNQVVADTAFQVWLHNNAEALLDLATPPEPQVDEVAKLREAAFPNVEFEQHPIGKAILDVRARAAGTFTPEFSGQRFADFDRGLLAAFEAANGAIQKLRKALGESQ